MFTMLSGIRLNANGRPYMGTISSNLNPHGFARPPHHRLSGPPSAAPSPLRAAPAAAAAAGARPGHLAGRMASALGGEGGGPVALLEIHLDKETTPVFEPGQEVAGKVVLVCSGSLRFKSLAVSMRGAARVHWKESRLLGSQQYAAEIEYFNKKRCGSFYLIKKATFVDGRLFL